MKNKNKSSCHVNNTAYIIHEAREYSRGRVLLQTYIGTVHSNKHGERESYVEHNSTLQKFQGTLMG
jgi:hypothetical protein